jgi:hypothetical protein
MPPTIKPAQEPIRITTTRKRAERPAKGTLKKLWGIKK